MAELLRHQRLVYLNTGASTAEYNLIGQGFTALSVSANAKTAEKHYIHERNATNSVIGYAPVMAFTSLMDDTDPVSLYLQKIADQFKVGEECESDIIIVDLWKEGETTGTYEARKQTVMIQIDNPGSSDAGAELGLTGSFVYIGDAVSGTFNQSSKAFTIA